MEKSCTTCMHEDVEINQHPCKECFNENRWTPKSDNNTLILKADTYEMAQELLIDTLANLRETISKGSTKITLRRWIESMHNTKENKNGRED